MYNPDWFQLTFCSGLAPGTPPPGGAGAAIVGCGMGGMAAMGFGLTAKTETLFNTHNGE